MESLKEEFENIIYNYLKENQRKAFTSVVLRKKIEQVIRDPQRKEYGRKNFQNILNQMTINGKIRITQHEGKQYYFISEKFKSSQDDEILYYFAPEIFISAEKDNTNKVKRKYCNICKKEVTIQFRSQKGLKDGYRLNFPFLSSLTQKDIEARANTGWFCPNCGQKIPILKKTKIIAYLSWIILTGFLITSAIFTKGELQICLFVWAIFFSVVAIFITILYIVSRISIRSGMKTLEKMKKLPKDSLKLK